ncbi:hypothetical protein BH10BDE1_BH10BDE1_14190 [soil metagenome]
MRKTKKKIRRVTKKSNATGRDKSVLKTIIHSEAVLRLRRAGGHLDKVIKMAEAGAGLTEILQQLSAVISALGGCRLMLFNGHMRAKLRSALRGGNEPLVDEIEKLASRIMKVN